MKYLSITRVKSGVILSLIGLFCCMGFTQNIVAQQFEGAITYKMEADGESQDLTYFMKRNKARVEIAIEQLGGNAVVLIDSESGNMNVLMEQLNMYMEIPIPQDERNADYEEAEGFHLTGETKTIANIQCQQYLFSDERGNETEIWTPVDEEFGNFLFPGMGNKMGTLKQTDMPDFTFFPFLVRSSGDDGPMHLEVISLEGKSLNDDLFIVPSNFRKMDIKMFGN
ncbi:MAG: DUF4412 domain-containing protein [Balneolales bacterium]